MFIGSSNSFEDDACLIKLAGPAEYSDYIKPVCLPAAGQHTIANETCKIAGWGVTKIGMRTISATVHTDCIAILMRSTEL